MLSQLTFRCDSPNRISSRMNNSKHNIGFRKRYSFVHLGDRKRLPECKDSAVVRGHSRSPWKWPVDYNGHSLNSVLLFLPRTLYCIPVLFNTFDFFDHGRRMQMVSLRRLPRRSHVLHSMRCVGRSVHG